MAILQRLEQLGGEAKNYIVVSSDREVQKAARRAGARVTDSRAFSRALTPRRPEGEPGEKPQAPLGPEEIEEWRQLFDRR
jgi:hypothetical protein